MADTYGHIDYRPPAKPAQEYADRALTILADLQAAAPGVLPVFLTSNSVLTLSGVRAYDAYHIFYPFQTAADRKTAAAVLARHGVSLLSDERMFGPDEDSQDSFELLNAGSLADIWYGYRFKGWEELAALVRPGMPYDETHFCSWSFVVERALAGMMEAGSLPKAWLRDWWAPHNLRFGMLLGYPAKAIESYLYSEARAGKNAEAGEEDLYDAEIDFYDAYFSAWPVYGYAPELKDDPQIVAHQRLWSEILRQVYTSDWHRAVRENNDFTEAYGRIKSLEEGGPATDGA